MPWKKRGWTSNQIEITRCKEEIDSLVHDNWVVCDIKLLVKYKSGQTMPAICDTMDMVASVYMGRNVGSIPHWASRPMSWLLRGRKRNCADMWMRIWICFSFCLGGHIQSTNSLEIIHGSSPGDHPWSNIEFRAEQISVNWVQNHLRTEILILTFDSFACLGWKRRPRPL